jgi:hypothetical protein
MSYKVAETSWNAGHKLIETIFSGDVDEDDIAKWERSLHHAINQVPDGTTFKIIVNLYGFKAINIQAHKRYREIIPRLLANYNWKVGYVDLFEESTQMKFQSIRNINCAAAVHVHQDEEKIKKYEERFSRDNEHFMTDPLKAKDWILNYMPN